jgi:hypothetical protein
MSITNLQANRILDYNFGNTAYSVPANLYIGLSTTAINNDGTGATEPSGFAYTRMQLGAGNNKTTWTVAGTPGASQLQNAVAVTFPESTGSWGTISHVFIADAISGGNILYFDALSPARAVAINTTVQFTIASIVISMLNA